MAIDRAFAVRCRRALASAHARVIDKERPPLAGNKRMALLAMEVFAGP